MKTKFKFQFYKEIYKNIPKIHQEAREACMHVQDQIRELVKDIYGDEYDVAVTNTCESALRVSFEALFAPPTMRKGDAYRGRFIMHAPMENDQGAQGSRRPP